MRSRHFILGTLLVALMLSLTFGAFGRAQESTPPASDAGSPVPSGTPIGGWATWQTIELTDALSGKTFTLADFYGKTVLVQPMATWCPSCRDQQKKILEARNNSGGAQIIVVSISVETTLKDEGLAAYAREEGFDWQFVVASDDLLRELVDEFGRTLANPPSTPHFLLLPDGTFTDLETGKLSPEEILEWIKTAETE